MLEQDPVEGKQREPGNHVGTGSSRRETNGDRPGNHVGTGSSRRETNGDRPGLFDFRGASTTVLTRGLVTCPCTLHALHASQESFVKMHTTLAAAGHPCLQAKRVRRQND